MFVSSVTHSEARAVPNKWGAGEMRFAKCFHELR